MARIKVIWQRIRKPPPGIPPEFKTVLNFHTWGEAEFYSLQTAKSDLDYEQSPFFLRDSRASETRARVKITSRVSPFLAWGDFHARSRFARSTFPEEKWGLLVVYEIVYPILIKASKFKPSSIKIHIPYTFSIEVVARI